MQLCLLACLNKIPVWGQHFKDNKINPKYDWHIVDWKLGSTVFIIPGAAEGVQDWSDHLKRTSIWQLLVRPELWKYKALTINKKIFGPTKVEVVGPAPPALYTRKYDAAYYHGDLVTTPIRPNYCNSTCWSIFEIIGVKQTCRAYPPDDSDLDLAWINKFIGWCTNRGFLSSLNLVLNLLFLHEEEANSDNFYLNKPVLKPIIKYLKRGS